MEGYWVIFHNGLCKLYFQDSVGDLFSEILREGKPLETVQKVFKGEDSL
jgi:hypothetical protein